MEHSFRFNLTKGQKVLIICQLCAVFSLLFWHVGKPFLGAYFELRSRLLLYEYVTGESPSPTGSEARRLYFQNLPDPQKNSLIAHYQNLKAKMERPLTTKIEEGISHFLFKTPPFELAWIVFSIAISLMLLLGIEGSRSAVWILPIVTFFYGLDSTLAHTRFPPSADTALFPSEALLVEKYIPEPLPSTITEQKKTLQMGWENYLIAHWSGAEPQLQHTRDEQLNHAMFQFTLARLQTLEKTALHFETKEVPLFLIELYLGWNLLLAWSIQERAKKRPIPAK